MSRNTPKQTPFDDLVPRPGTPSSPPPAGPPPANNTLPLAGRTNAPATRVVAALQDDEPDDDTPNTTVSVGSSVRSPHHRIRRKMLPTGTLVGLAMVGGAFIVLALSAIFSRVVPRAQTKSLPPPISTGPRVVEAPREDPLRLTPQEEADAARRALAESAEKEADRTPAEAGSSGTVVNEEDTTRADSSATDTDAEPGTQDGDEAPRLESSSRDESRSDTTDHVDTERDGRSGSREERRTRTSSNSSGFEHGSTGYRIEPPSGFRLQKTGRRTVWRGPGGSQLLVETSNSPGRSPRADWEQLDKALSKKYGSRYRSHGIRETTLAGRPAAVWEFEIGDTRKVDVAVHHRGKGYAVLAEAPVEDFESLRPQLESAIRSFELPSKSTRRSDRSSSRTKSRRGSEDSNSTADESGSGY